MSMLFKRIKDWATSITDFRTGDYIAVDGPGGTAKMAAELIATKENIINTQSSIVDLNDSSYWQNGGLNSTSGKEFDAADRLRTIFLKLTETGVMTYTAQSGVSFTWAFFCYNSNKEFLGYASNSHIANLIATYPTAVWFRLALNSITGITPDASHIEDVASFGGSLHDYDVVRESQLEQVYTELETLDEKIDHLFDDGKTALNMNDTAFWQNGGIDSSYGTETTASDRLRTIFLRLTSDSNISYFKKSGVNFSRALYCYDENKVYLGYSGSASIATALESYPSAVWFRIGLTGITGATVDYTNIANIFDWRSGLYEVVDGYETRLENIEEQIGGFIYQDPLKGKTWYACGDSFTAGVTGDVITENGPYKGYRACYPYFVGNRTGMDVHNIAVSGSTMTYKSGTSTASNCFSYPSTGKYLSIPADADYITLKFGINDDPSHQDMPLGTISDNTNETLYGAWNVVISYLVANCPYAKIGVIVSNGCYDPNYSKAARDIAEKWGLGYLDENFDYKVPLLIRVTGKPNVSSAAHNAVLAKMRVSESNTHPNDWAHEYESKIVEAWLRTL